LIQRDESTDEKHPIMYYSKLPPRITTYDRVLLVDPMLATGGSVIMAIKVSGHFRIIYIYIYIYSNISCIQTLIGAGVSENNIIFLNVVSCPFGIKTVFAQYPNVKIITAGIDPELNANKYIVPGLGDFGDRYYNTLM